MGGGDMARRDSDKRLERAIDDGREWVERTAADVAERLSRAWSYVRDRADDGEDEKGGEPEKALFDESRADPEELFSHDRQREVARLGHANILIIGQTGVGKSTLINAV